MQRPPFTFDHLPHLSCDAFISAAVHAAKNLPRPKTGFTVGSRVGDCKQKTLLDAFFYLAPANFAARSPPRHVANESEPNDTSGLDCFSTRLGRGPQPQPSCGSRGGQSRGDHQTSRSRATRV